MINGSINRVRQATVPIIVLNPAGQQLAWFNPVIDTGFNGDLQLPVADITRLNLPLVTTRRTILADGQEVDADVYAATVQWLGNSRGVEIIAARDLPLIGANLLWETSLTIDWEYGGQVAITPLPE